MRMEKAKDTKGNFYPLLCWDIYYNESVSKIKGLDNKAKEPILKCEIKSSADCKKY